MSAWLVALLSAFGGAVFTTVLRELVEWNRRPRLQVDFEEFNGHKPYILDLPLESRRIAGRTSKAKFIRINVHNTGRKPAMNCEAKMVIYKEGKKEASTPVIIHWARRDPAVYKTLEQIYAPIHLNRNDEEPLDLLMLPYYAEDPDLPGATIETLSPRPYYFERTVAYDIKVTVYANNTISNPFVFKLCWDGTRAGFHKAVQKVRKSQNVENL